MIWVNGKAIEVTSFPNGESKVNHNDILDGFRNGFDGLVHRVTMKYESDKSLIELMFVKDYLDNLSLKSVKELTLLYMPYSRMDRSEGGSAFTLKSVSMMINRMGFDKVKVVEPHSHVCLGTLDRALALYPTFGLLEVVADMVGFDKAKDYLFFPDEGASKRYSSITGYNVGVGYKKRNFQTGEILGLEIVTPMPIEKDPFVFRKALICDDLSSYGGTFRASAQKLREIGFEEVFLLVAHCEDSIHERGLLDSGLIDKVFTTDTILTNKNHENLHVFDMTK